MTATLMQMATSGLATFHIVVFVAMLLVDNQKTASASIALENSPKHNKKP